MKKDHGKEPARKSESRKSSGLKPQDLEFFKKLLLDLRQRYSQKVENLAEGAFTPDAGGVSASPSHLGDVGFDYYSQEISLDLLQNEREILWEIEEALSRLAKGVYGVCEECGEAIARERLELLPFTRYCIDCARKLESES
ncbi:MAG: TraR/DksA C4-type zinc finger protein [Gemmatales bacterium]|nr:TraR/DksA C4-type zinc finger protein [Gemmatales bacterium]MCS7160338.1 TraR/DksA C4-type zinc finger protein [Gemmatales bacterium]MDW8175538.1 TraR/DksA C4-type zinc finger protein [Gemmatales bacterium]MDW8223007.1 TraR/DksA C4-type zinc finger protein [Gemmatales bacterium]